MISTHKSEEKNVAERFQEYIQYNGERLCNFAGVTDMLTITKFWCKRIHNITQMIPGTDTGKRRDNMAIKANKI